MCAYIEQLRNETVEKTVIPLWAAYILMVLFEKIEEYDSNLPLKFHPLGSSRLFIARK